jgi:hypothetical protein
MDKLVAFNEGVNNHPNIGGDDRCTRYVRKKFHCAMMFMVLCITLLQCLHVFLSIMPSDLVKEILTAVFIEIGEEIKNHTTSNISGIV